MDYLSWVKQVMHGMIDASRKVDEKLIDTRGVDFKEIGVALGFDKTELQTSEPDKPTMAILGALRDLQSLGFVEQQIVASFFRLTQSGRELASQDLSVFPNIIETQFLEPEQLAVLGKLVEVCPEDRGQYVALYPRTMTDIGKALGSEWTPNGVYNRLLELRELGLASLHIGTRTATGVPTYRGFLRILQPQYQSRNWDLEAALQYSERALGIQTDAQPSTNASMASRRRNQVFVSYSHKDKKWLTTLQTFLKPHVREGGLTVWDDTHIKPGAKWKDEIKEALSRAKVAVLLVSSYFLASDFIAKDELPPLLKAAEEEGLTIIWIPVSFSAYKKTAIAQYQAAHDPNKPLDSLKGAQRSKTLVEVCDFIMESAQS